MTWRTTIEYSDSSWNPVRGCTPVSEGCRWCIAARIAGRYAEEGQTYYGIATLKDERPVWTGSTQFVDKHFYDPLNWDMGRVIMTGTMTDLFYSQIPNGWRDPIFATMALCPQHEFQLTTKHPKRMFSYFTHFRTWPRIEAAARRLFQMANGKPYASTRALRGPMRHLWLGISAEDQETATERLYWLRKVPAAIRFCSLEPLLGPVDLRPFLTGPNPLQWVTVGGESAPEARPLRPDWVRDIRDQCLEAGVPFFFKQWGSWVPIDPELELLFPEQKYYSYLDGTTLVHIDRKTETALLDGTAWNQMPDSMLYPTKVTDANIAAS